MLDVTKATMTRSTKLDAKLDSLSKQVERLAAGAPREQAPPPREVPNEAAHIVAAGRWRG